MKREEDKIRHNVSLRKGDMVRVMRGSDREDFRHKTARVLSVDSVAMKVTVEHAHMIKRHTRPNPSKNIKGGIVERESAIHISNVMLVCPGCNRPTRIGHNRLADGSRVRICRRCGVTLDK
jgi:large subunit ribosomal protein L24